MLEIILFDQALDHIIGGYQHIIGFTAGQLGVHHLIGLKGLIHHSTVIFLLKLFKKRKINIFSCIIHLQHMTLSCCTAAFCKAKAKSRHYQKCDHTLNLFRMLTCMLLKNRRKHICENKYQNNNHDYNGRQGINGWIDSLGHIVNNNRNIFHTVAGYKIRNYKIIKGHGKRKQGAGENTVLDHRHNYLCQCLEGCCSKIHCRICQIGIQTSYLWINTGDNIWRTKGNMRQQHGDVSLAKAQ